MSTILKKKAIEKSIGGDASGSVVKSHANDPFVVKKVQEAAETIQRVGLPGQNKK